MTLKELQIGKSAVVDTVGGTVALRQHFLDMGLVPGAQVTLIKLAPMGDPMELRIHGYELTLRLDDAAQIGIIPTEKVPAAPALVDDKMVDHPGLGEGGKYHIKKGEHPLPDGTGVRDYIHVVDLARGHVCAIRKLETGCGLFICNLGTGKGYSVLDVIHAFSKACGKEIPYVIDPRRPGDIAECYADPTKAKNELGWVAEYGIEEMCADSWNWQKNNPDGYHTVK